MQKNLMKQTAVYSLLFSAAALGAVFYMTGYQASAFGDAGQKEIRQIAAGDAPQDTGLNGGGNVSDIIYADGTGQSQDDGAVAGNELTFEVDTAGSSYLSVPLPPGTGADSVMIENHYMEEEMWIVIEDDQEEFYDTAVISGNRRHILSGVYEKTATGVALKFSLNDIYEFRSILEDNRVYIEFIPPREMFDKIIVVDPAYGGSAAGYEADSLKEKEIAIAIAEKLQEKLSSDDIKVYYTRMDDNNPSEESRVRIANNTKADMLIRIEANGDEDSAVYGTLTVYNKDYFIPGFGNTELADILEKEVVTSIKGKALGLQAAGADDYVILQATIPAAAIRVGYLTNAQEAILLKKEDYIEKLAAGIYNAIMKVYEESYL